MAIDRAVRGLVARLVARTLPTPGPDAMAHVRRVLLLRHDAIGDMLSSLPLIRALAEAGLEVGVVASPENAVVLAGNPWGVVVHVTHGSRMPRRSLARALAVRRYDAVVDGLVLKPSVNSRTLRLLRASRAAVRIGTGGRAHDFVYTHPVHTDLGANHVEVLASLLAPFGIPPTRALDLVPMPLTDAERATAGSWWADGAGPRLFVNLSASSAERRWSDVCFIETLRLVRSTNPAIRIAITGSPADWPAVRAVAKASGGMAFTGTLRAAFALLASSEVVLTPDTSVAHAAAGFGVSSVVLTPQTNLRFAPWRARARLVVSPGRSLEPVQVADVVEHIGAALAELGAR